MLIEFSVSFLLISDTFRNKWLQHYRTVSSAKTRDNKINFCELNAGHIRLNCRIMCCVTWLRYPLFSSVPSHESRYFKSNHCHYNPLLFAVYFPSVSWSEMNNFRNWFRIGKYTWNKLTDLGIAYGKTATIVWTGWERRQILEARSLAVGSRTRNHAPPEHNERLLTKRSYSVLL